MVKLTVKTIKGKKFQIEVEQTQTVREVKGVIEQQNAEFPAAQLKLIHSGQILKDDSTLAEYKIKEEEFLVCMVTKPKAAAAAPAAAPAPAPSPAPTPAAAAPPAPAPAPAAAAAAPNADHVRQLTEMGFPEDQATAALRAAMGNPDVAVEFLMTGIPDNVQAAAAPAQAAPAVGAMETLEDFRGHPQFNDLKRLVQRDPTQLSRVLQMIGQQSPNLLARIHENQGDFIALMNEPVDEAAPPAPAAPAGGMSALGSMMGAGGQLNNAAQVAQLLQGMNPAQRAQMAAAMGVSPQQLAQVSQLIGQMPQEQFQQLMGMMNAGGVPGGGMGGMGGMPPGAGAGAGGNVIRLSEEEGAAVGRLTELGFDRTDAAQAYLACDKNEALAANFLLNEMGGGMSAFQAPAPTPAPAPAAALAGAPVPAPTPTASSDSATTTPSAAAESTPAETPTAPSPSTATATGESAPADPTADSNPQGGGDEDEDMYG